MAEREGFEPSMGYKPMPVFKTGAFNRSATSPQQNARFYSVLKHDLTEVNNKIKKRICAKFPIFPNGNRDTISIISFYLVSGSRVVLKD